MKRLTLLLTSSLAAGLLLFATAAHTAATYNVNVRALQTAAGEGEGVAFVLDASGDLPGMGKVVFKREGGNVTGGSWALTVLPPNADATSSERGKLSGSVTGGTLSFDEGGVPTGASEVRLSVEGGTGEHAGVSGGTGTINLSPDPENPSRLKGTLVLNF
jgi:hypothetical protein